MQLKIADHKSIEEIKEEFTADFPYLKLEFFHHSHKKGEGSPPDDMINVHQTIGEIRRKKTEGVLEIKGEMRVSELENAFEKQYGMHVQVFRKSGNVWLETSATDDWTIHEQNQTGREMT